MIFGGLSFVFRSDLFLPFLQDIFFLIQFKYKKIQLSKFCWLIFFSYNQNIESYNFYFLRYTGHPNNSPVLLKQFTKGKFGIFSYSRRLYFIQMVCEKFLLSAVTFTEFKATTTSWVLVFYTNINRLNWLNKVLLNMGVSKYRYMYK